MKLKKLFSSVCSVLTSLTLLIAVESYFPANVLASENQLNIRIFMCTTITSDFDEIITDKDEPTINTYGMPTSFNERLPAVTGYVHAYYANLGAYINFLKFNGYGMLESPARICADDAASHNTTFFNIVKYGCPCNGVTTTGDDKCFAGTLHHNNYLSFRNHLLSTDLNSAYAFDSTNMYAIYLTASSLCSNIGGSHHGIYGIHLDNDNIIVASDADYREKHDDENAYAYARSVLVHEIGHAYNVSDHQSGAVLDYSPYCLWGAYSGRYEVITACQSCTACRDLIYENRNIYQHS